MSDEKTQEDKEYEYELMVETGARLEDLAMALCHFNDEMAQQALALALGTLVAQYEEPGLAQLMELATAQMETVRKQMMQIKSESN